MCAAKTPVFLVDTPLLRRNLSRVRERAEEAGCAVLARPREIPRFLLPYLRGFTDGTAAQTLGEARFGWAHLGGAVHFSAAACGEEGAADAAALCSHVSFCSLSQAQKHRAVLERRGALAGLTVTLRNLSEVCRLGGALLRKAGVTGLRLVFPDSCALDAWKTLETRGKAALGAVRWLSFGRGFSLAGDEGRAELSAGALREIKKRCGLALYIEAGHELLQGAVHLLCTVLDVIPGRPPAAVLDAVAAPVAKRLRPRVDGAGYPGEKPWGFRLCGMTGARGDVFGDYSFDAPPQPGRRLLLRDVARFAAAQERDGDGPLPFLPLDEE